MNLIFIQQRIWNEYFEGFDKLSKKVVDIFNGYFEGFDGSFKNVVDFCNDPVMDIGRILMNRQKDVTNFCYVRDTYWFIRNRHVNKHELNIQVF